VDEAIRLIDAFQFVEKYGEVCPANWQAGDRGIKADVSGLKKPGVSAMANGSSNAKAPLPKSLQSVLNSH
jgi:hypothetical protein